MLNPDIRERIRTEVVTTGFGVLGQIEQESPLTIAFELLDSFPIDRVFFSPRERFPGTPEYEHARVHRGCNPGMVPYTNLFFAIPNRPLLGYSFDRNTPNLNLFNAQLVESRTALTAFYRENARKNIFVQRLSSPERYIVML